MNLKNEKLKNKRSLNESRLGVYLRKSRQKAMLSQLEVAQLCDCQPQFVSNIERNLCVAPYSLLKKLIRIYKLQKKELFNILVDDFKSELKAKLNF